MDATELGHFELAMIASDCRDLTEVVLSLQNPDAAAMAGLGMPPLVAWFVGESRPALERLLGSSNMRDLSEDLFSTYKDCVAKLRARTKLFDDSRGGLDGLVDTFELAQQQSLAWFNHDHMGPLGWLQRRLQPDLGIFWVGNNPIATTHSALLTVGLTHDRLAALDPASMTEVLSSFGHDLAVAMGEYVGHLGGAFEQAGLITMPSYESVRQSTLSVTHSDHYAARAYADIRKAIDLPAPQHAVAALFVDAQVNFVREVLSTMLRSDGLLSLRARFLCAYHATAAVERLSELACDTPGAQRLKTVAASKVSQRFPLMRRERNLMAHYGLRRAADGAPSDSNALDWAIRESCGLDLGELSAVVDSQLTAIAEAFATVVDKDSMRSSRAWLGDHT